MPKYRKLHTCTLDSLDMASMPDDFTRLTWLMLPLILSREGTTIYSGRYLRSKLYPLREDVTPEAIQTSVDWLIEKEMLFPYGYEGRQYLWCPTFRKYQGCTEREAESTFPSPPLELIAQFYPDGHAVQPRAGHDKLMSKSCSQVDAQVDADTNAQVDALTDELVGAVYTAWMEARGGTLNSLEAEEIGGLIDEHGADVVLAGIREAIRGNRRDKPNLNYLRAIVGNTKKPNTARVDPGGVI